MSDSGPQLTAEALLPFVPSRDYARSQAFYQALGFQPGYQDEQLTEFALGPCRFYLQKFYSKAFASNFVMQLLVKDLDAWWQHMLEMELTRLYPEIKAEAPEIKPWGQRLITLIDPSGVLWYIAQL